MFIRYGFRITFATNNPTAVLTRLDVHPDRRQDIRNEGRFTISGFDAEQPFVDLHGNFCRRVTAFPGQATLELSGIIGPGTCFDPEKYACDLGRIRERGTRGDVVHSSG